MFLDPDVMDGITESFYNHLVYTLTYRTVEGRGLATVLYLMEKAALKGVKFWLYPPGWAIARQFAN